MPAIAALSCGRNVCSEPRSRSTGRGARRPQRLRGPCPAGVRTRAPRGRPPGKVWSCPAECRLCGSIPTHASRHESRIARGAEPHPAGCRRLPNLPFTVRCDRGIPTGVRSGHRRVPVGDRRSRCHVQRFGHGRPRAALGASGLRGGCTDVSAKQRSWCRRFGPAATAEGREVLDLLVERLLLSALQSALRACPHWVRRRCRSFGRRRYRPLGRLRIRRRRPAHQGRRLHVGNRRAADRRVLPPSSDDPVAAYSRRRGHGGPHRRKPTCILAADGAESVRHRSRSEPHLYLPIAQRVRWSTRL